MSTSLLFQQNIQVSLRFGCLSFSQ